MADSAFSAGGFASDFKFHELVELVLHGGHRELCYHTGDRRQAQLLFVGADIDRTDEIYHRIGIRRYLRIQEGKLRDQILSRLRHRRTRHDELAGRQMRQAQRGPRGFLFHTTLDPMAFVKEDMNFVTSTVGSH